MKISACRSCLAAIVSLVSILSCDAVVQADEVFPSRPIRFINPYPAGGPTDLIARRLAEAVSPRLGQPVLIENKTGGNGSIGAAEALKGADGYTYLVTVPDPLLHQAILMESITYDPRKDFVLMTQVARAGLVLVANLDMPDSLGAMVALAKTKPGSISFGSFGNGSQSHLISEAIARRDNLQLNHIPYRGGGPAVQDVIGKQISFSYAAPIFASQLARDGKVRVFAVTGTSRAEVLPDVPTFGELGYTHPLLAMRYWVGVVAPAAAPKDAVARVLKEIQTAVATPEFKQFLVSTGWEVINNSPEDFAKEFRSEYDIIEKSVSEFGIPRM